MWNVEIIAFLLEKIIAFLVLEKDARIFCNAVHSLCNFQILVFLLFFMSCDSFLVVTVYGLDAKAAELKLRGRELKSCRLTTVSVPSRNVNIPSLKPLSIVQSAVPTVN